MKKIIASMLVSMLFVPSVIFAAEFGATQSNSIYGDMSNISPAPAPKTSVGPTIENAKKADADAAAKKAFDESPDNISGSKFTLDVNSLSPGADKYTGGPKENIGNLLKKIARFLLIIIPTLAVMFMVVGAIKIMLAGGDSSKINNGKAIITYNIIAVVLALMSWSIIQLIIWIVGNAA